MSAAGLFGLIFNTFCYATIWTVLGMAFEKIGNIFNDTIKVMPSLPDAVNGFNLMQIAWGVILIIGFLALIFNYISNESQMVPGEQ
jgi:hypothetical protein